MKCKRYPEAALIMQLMINQGLRLSDGMTTPSSMLRHVTIGRPRGFASSANRVPEQIRFHRLDHLVQPWTTQLKCACCGMKTKRRCSMCKVGIHDRCFIQFHTTWTVWFCACFFLVLSVMNMCFITVKLELLISNVMYCYFWRPNDWQ